MASIVDAFGIPITLTRPPPDDDPITTSGVWIAAPPDEQAPYGTDLRRREPRRVMGIPRDATLTHIPRGSTVLAPETDGGEIKTWKTDGLASPTDPDLIRVFIVPTSDL